MVKDVLLYLKYKFLHSFCFLLNKTDFVLKPIQPLITTKLLTKCMCINLNLIFQLQNNVIFILDVFYGTHSKFLKQKILNWLLLNLIDGFLFVYKYIYIYIYIILLNYYERLTLPLGLKLKYGINLSSLLIK